MHLVPGLYIGLFTYIVQHSLICDAARILELSDRFLEYKDKDVWLVKVSSGSNETS